MKIDEMLQRKDDKMKEIIAREKSKSVEEFKLYTSLFYGSLKMYVRI